ncbi:MAG: hypothetical protein CVV27_13850 [Candidatus Melainabacteria bacterium HGW-Melainabacteria-1]|nr:MAG: hypothetical protein CVV27_13850 [Candidatus Melainabacteria bacterium HGW-Melainabacteria-1]
MPAGKVRPLGKGSSFKTEAVPQLLMGTAVGSRDGKGAGVALWPGAGGMVTGVACGVGVGVGVAVAGLTSGVANGSGVGPGVDESGSGPQAERLRASRVKSWILSDVFIHSSRRAGSDLSVINLRTYPMTGIASRIDPGQVQEYGWIWL